MILAKTILISSKVCAYSSPIFLFYRSASFTLFVAFCLDALLCLSCSIDFCIFSLSRAYILVLVPSVYIYLYAYLSALSSYWFSPAAMSLAASSSRRSCRNHTRCFRWPPKSASRATRSRSRRRCAFGFFIALFYSTYFIFVHKNEVLAFWHDE